MKPLLNFIFLLFQIMKEILLDLVYLRPGKQDTVQVAIDARVNNKGYSIGQWLSVVMHIQEKRHRYAGISDFPPVIVLLADNH